MKRLLSLGAVLVLAVASIVLAQTSGQATLRTQSGDHPITVVQQSGQTYVSATDVVTGLGGTIVPPRPVTTSVAETYVCPDCWTTVIG